MCMEFTVSRSSSKSSSGGYDYQFVEEPSDDLKCLICLCVARDPQQHGDGGCGKIFCTSCINKHKRTNDMCPNCRINIKTFSDVRSERDIQSLMVMCENLQDNCEWTGEVRSIEEHLKTCDYTKLPCSKKCKSILRKRQNPSVRVKTETTKVFRKDLQKHLEDECPRRQYSCPHCEETGEYQDITGKHTEICPKMEINCPNKPQCQIKVLRENKFTHLLICRYEKVPCKYAELGCEVTPYRKDIQEHQTDDKAHLYIAMDTVISVKKECAFLQDQVCNARLENDLTRNIAPFTFALTEYIANQIVEVYYDSSFFYSHPRGYKMFASVYLNGVNEGKGTHLSVFVQVAGYGIFDGELEFPFKGTVTIKLLNQLENKNHHQKSISMEANPYDDTLHNRSGGFNQFISNEKLGFNATRNCQYLKDDRLVFRISVDVPSYKPWLQCTNTN